MKSTLYNWKSESLINLNLTAESIHFCIWRIIFLSFVHLKILYIWMAWYYFRSTENPTYSSKSRSRFIFLKSPLWRWVHANVFFLFFKNNFIYVFLTVLGFHCCVGFSLVTASRVYSLILVRGFFIAVASLDAEFRLSGAWASVSAAPGL